METSQQLQSYNTYNFPKHKISLAYLQPKHLELPKATHKPETANSSELSLNEEEIILDSSNPIMRWIDIDNGMREQGLLDEERAALSNLRAVMTEMSKEFGSKDQNRDERTIGEKILAVYDVLERNGFMFRSFDRNDTYGDSLIHSLANKHLDCDTSSALVIGVATALGWPNVNLVMLRDHAFVRWNNQNFDSGYVRPDETYLDEYGDPKQHEIKGTVGVESLAWAARGITTSRLGNGEDGITSFTNAISLNPRHASAHNNRGLLYMVEGHTSKALEDFSKALEVDPNYTSAFTNREAAYRKINN